MKHPTSHLAKLEKDLDEAKILIKGVPLHQSTTNLHHLKVQAYILLTHAALETYIEELGKDVALTARRLFKSKGTITHSLVALVASKIFIDLSEKSKKKVTVDLVSSLDAFSEAACSGYLAIVESNNGIKLKNLNALFQPIGVEPSIADLATANTLEGYGQIRGDIAHSFSAIRNEHTVSSVSTTLQTIRAGIKAFDLAACGAIDLAMTKSSIKKKP